MFKKLLLSALVIVLLIAAWIYLTVPARRVAEGYLSALASGKAQIAASMSSGPAAQAAARLDNIQVKAQVENISTSIYALGHGWVRMRAAVELTLQDDSPDVGWYVLELVSGQDGWKVVSFRKSEPVVSGIGITWGKREGASKVFQEYLDTLAVNRYTEAARLLVGPAREAHEAGAFILGKAPVIKEAGAVDLTPLWKRGKLLEARADYTVDGRRASVFVLFFRAPEGWKIAEIKQI